MTRKKLVLIRPGYHELDHQFAYWMTKKGFEVVLLAPEQAFQQNRTLKNRITNYQIEKYRTINSRFFSDFPVGFNLWSKIKKIKPDIINSGEDYQFSTWLGYLYAKKYNVKFIILMDRYLPPRNFLIRLFFKLLDIIFINKILRDSSLIICHSSESLKYLRSKIDKNSVNSVFLPIGVDRHKFYPLPYKRREDVSLKIISVGRLIEQKNYPTLIKAITYLIKKKNKRLSLTIIGSGILRDYLKRMIKNLQMTQAIRLIFHVDHDNLVNIINEHNLFILSSKRESMGAVVLEAMACGLPVIVSDAGGMKDFVQEGKNGFVFKQGSYLDLAEKIEIFLNDRNKLKIFGDYSLKLVKERFNNQILFDQYFKIFNEC